MFNIPQLKIVFFSSIKTATDLMKLIGDNNKFAIGVQYFYNISRKDKRILQQNQKIGIFHIVIADYIISKNLTIVFGKTR